MFSIVKTLKKSILGFLTGLAAVVVLGISQSVTSFECDSEVSGFICHAWLAVVPTVSAFLVGIANWLKHRNVA